jgi:hypothetical protein
MGGKQAWDCKPWLVANVDPARARLFNLVTVLVTIDHPRKSLMWTSARCGENMIGLGIRNVVSVHFIAIWIHRLSNYLILGRMAIASLLLLYLTPCLLRAFILSEFPLGVFTTGTFYEFY